MNDASGRVRRVVSLTPSNTEVLWALDATDRLIGVDDHSDFPPQLSAQRVGPDLQIDVEAVEALQPDLVLASLSVPGMERVVEGVEAAGLPVEVFAPKSLDDVLEDHVRIGRLLDLDERAEGVVDELRQRIARVAAATEGADSMRVLWEWWPKPLICAGAPSWMTGVIETAGGVNVLDDRQDESPVLEPAEVPGLEPDAIGVCWCGTMQRVLDTARKRVADRDGWASTPAVRDGRVWPLDEALFGRPGPRLVDGLELLAWLMHPDLVDQPTVHAPAHGLLPDHEGRPVFHPPPARVAEVGT